MRIEKVNIEPKVSKFEYANNIIKDCVAQGVGVYKLTDDEKIFTTNQRMYEYLSSACGRHNLFNKDSKYKVRVFTKNHKEHIFVEVKEKDEN